MSTIFNEIEIHKFTSVKKFYFLEYYYILLKSIEVHSEKNEIFQYFKGLKEKFHLGNSRYKKNIFNSFDGENSKQEISYVYTFNEVVSESVSLQLINTKGDKYILKEEGRLLIALFECDFDAYILKVFNILEKRSNGFYSIIQACYHANSVNGGLLIFPTYSPLKLEIQKKDFDSKNTIVMYCNKLCKKLEADIYEFLNKTISLVDANEIILKRLTELELLADNVGFKYYNKIVKKVRDYWLNYFLQEIYEIKSSITYFDIWVYRAKQIGIMNSTEFYPNISGKIVYPISIVSNKRIKGNDFLPIFEYDKTMEALYLHKPNWDSFQDEFVDKLYTSYYDLKKRNRSYYVSLPDLRDVVCYKLKISNKTFEDFMKLSYSLNLQNDLRIKISLESDKVPEETKAMYSIREGILIEGVHKNIIAIDIKK